MRKVIMGGAAVLAAAGIGVGAAQLANADSPAPQPTDSASAPATPGKGSEEHKGHGKRLRMDTAALAQKLGVDEAKLTEALHKIREANAPGKQPSKEKADKPTKEDRSARQAALAKAVAEELGLDESKVASAMEEVRETAQQERAAEDKATLEQAVSEGKLTQAEADAVSKAADAGIVRIRAGR